MSLHVLIAGVSTRAAAASAARAGFRVTALDAFGDLDQHAHVHAVALPRDLRRAFTAGAAARASRSIACDAVAYLSPFENHVRAVTELARGRQLWGNASRVLQRARDPVRLADAVRRRGLAAPAVRVEAPAGARPGEWLLKPRASGGGHGIRTWQPGERVRAEWYLQEWIAGVPASVVFVAAAGRVAGLGLSRQIVGDPAFGSAGYRYCGSILPAEADPVWGWGSDLAARACAVARAAAEAFDLVGLNGVDLVVRDGCPLPIEVNPRWCASVELAERASGVSAFAAHALACTSGNLSGASGMRAPASAWGKAVVFARRGATVGDTRTWCEDATVADVPTPGTRLDAGQPVCTVFATAPDVTSCYAALVVRAERVYAALATWAR